MTLNADTAPESKDSKCHCGKPAVGVIPCLLGHRYVCREHAKSAEKAGWWVDYENDRL